MSDRSSTSTRPSAAGDAPLRVVVLGESSQARQALAQALPRAWIVREGALEPHQSLDEVDLLLVMEEDLQHTDAYGRLVAIRMEHPAKPMVLCVESVPGGLVNLEAVRPDAFVLLGSANWARLETLARGWDVDSLHELARGLATSGRIPAVLRRAMVLVCVQVPPSLAEADERDQRGQLVYVRKVKDAASIVGCRPGYLSGAASRAGIPLARFVRLVTLARGISLQRDGGDAWGTVAFRLGFRTSSAWTNFVVRLTGKIPRLLGPNDYTTALEQAAQAAKVNVKT